VTGTGDPYAIEIKHTALEGGDHVELTIQIPNLDQAAVAQHYTKAETTAAETYVAGVIARTLVALATSLHTTRAEHGCQHNNHLDNRCQLDGYLTAPSEDVLDPPFGCVIVPAWEATTYIELISQTLQRIQQADARTFTDEEEQRWQAAPTPPTPPHDQTRQDDEP
jgi:hypothetical protein